MKLILFLLLLSSCFATLSSPNGRCSDYSQKVAMDLIRRSIKEVLAEDDKVRLSLPDLGEKWIKAFPNSPFVSEMRKKLDEIDRMRRAQLNLKLYILNKQKECVKNWGKHRILVKEDMEAKHARLRKDYLSILNGFASFFQRISKFHSSSTQTTTSSTSSSSSSASSAYRAAIQEKKQNLLKQSKAIQSWHSRINQVKSKSTSKNQSVSTWKSAVKSIKLKETERNLNTQMRWNQIKQHVQASSQSKSSAKIVQAQTETIKKADNKVAGKIDKKKVKNEAEQEQSSTKEEQEPEKVNEKGKEAEDEQEKEQNGENNEKADGKDDEKEDGNDDEKPEESKEKKVEDCCTKSKEAVEQIGNSIVQKLESIDEHIKSTEGRQCGQCCPKGKGDEKQPEEKKEEGNGAEGSGEEKDDPEEAKDRSDKDQPPEKEKASEETDKPEKEEPEPKDDMDAKEDHEKEEAEVKPPKCPNSSPRPCCPSSGCYNPNQTMGSVGIA